MTNIYILSKNYHDLVFCSLFIGGQKNINVVAMYTRNTHTHTYTYT